VIARGVTIVTEASIDIGEKCLIGEYTSIRESNNRFDGSESIVDQAFVTSPIRIEDNVWIGRGCAMLKGLRIAKNAVVAANSLVNKAVLQGSLVAGAPARIVKQRTSEAKVDPTCMEGLR